VTQPVDSGILHEIVRVIESRRKVPEKVVVKSKEYLLTYLEDHQRRRDGRVVLRGDVDPVRVLGARVDLARERVRPANLAFRDAFLRHRVWSEPVLRIRVRAWRHGLLAAASRLRRSSSDARSKSPS